MTWLRANFYWSGNPAPFRGWSPQKKQDESHGGKRPFEYFDYWIIEACMHGME